MEIWKDISGYEGLYQVSLFGAVKRIKGKACLSDRYLRQQKNSRGYYQVSLSKEDKAKFFLVHRLVAAAFVVREFDHYIVINHINMNKEDNTFTNLEWCTQKMNCHSSRTRRGKTRRKKTALHD